jgi:outer membrane protein TolC
MKSTRLPLALACLLLAAPLARAGALQDYYATTLTADPISEVASLNSQAAAQNVLTQRYRHLPRVSLTARELWVYQDIQQSSNPTFANGNESFGNTRLNVVLDQPIYDPTISPLVDAARARQRQADALGRDADSSRTRRALQDFIETARLHAIIASCNLSVARLDKELADSARSLEARVATVTDVQNIRLALSAVRRERNNYEQRLANHLANLGTRADALKSISVSLTPAADTTTFDSTGSASSDRSVAVDVLTAQAAELGHQSTAASRRSLPVLGLYTQYGYDDAGGSEFGGAREVSTFEIGLAVRWDIFDRNMNRSEARELSLRRRAKEAELRAASAIATQTSGYDARLVEQSVTSTADLADLVKQHEVLRDATARAYDAGKESYLNAINAYLACESTRREWINARHDLLLNRIAAQARATGWDQSLVQKVDTLFVSTK